MTKQSPMPEYHVNPPVPYEATHCAGCGSYSATTARLGGHVCPGCAHMIDVHGARLYDAHAADPCVQEG